MHKTQPKGATAIIETQVTAARNPQIYFLGPHIVESTLDIVQSLQAQALATARSQLSSVPDSSDEALKAATRHLVCNHIHSLVNQFRANQPDNLADLYGELLALFIGQFEPAFIHAARSLQQVNTDDDDEFVNDKQLVN